MPDPSLLLVLSVLSFGTFVRRLTQFVDLRKPLHRDFFPMNLPLHVIFELRSWFGSGVLFLVGWVILLATQV